MGLFPDPILSFRTITKGQFVLFGVIALIADIAFDLHASAERRKEFDVTDKIASLGSYVDIHLNQIFKSDVVCRSSLFASLTETLDTNFPGKTFLKSDYDVAEEGVGFHIITIDDDNPVGKILDVNSIMIDSEGLMHCCSRDLVVRFRDTGKDRKFSINEEKTRCLEKQ